MAAISRLIEVTFDETGNLRLFEIVKTPMIAISSHTGEKYQRDLYVSK
jgi:hypothetical protein